MPERYTDRLTIRIMPSQHQRIRALTQAFDLDEAEMLRDIIMSEVVRAERRLRQEAAARAEAGDRTPEAAP